VVEQVLPPGLLVAGLVYHLWRLRRDPHNPVARWLAVMFGALAVAVGIGTPGPYLAFDRLVGIPNAARYVQHLAAMIGFTAVQILLLHVAGAAGRQRPRLYALGLVAAAMLALLTASPVTVEAPQDFVERYGGEATVAAYLLLFVGFLGVGVVDVIVSCYRLARDSRDRPWLRAGFITLAAGGVVGLAYVVSKGLFTVLAWRGIVPAGQVTESTLSRLSVAVGAVLAAVGVLLPAMGAQVEAVRGWYGRRRRHRDLEPLWRAVCLAVPRVALPDSDRAGSRDLRWSLDRREVEIQDGLLELRFYRDQDAAARAHRLGSQEGLAGAQLRAVTEAADIAAAIERVLAGAGPTDEGDPSPLVGQSADPSAWLATVARAFAARPHVAARRGQATARRGQATA
jgi:hypothetical protein